MHAGGVIQAIQQWQLLCKMYLQQEGVLMGCKAESKIPEHFEALEAARTWQQCLCASLAN